jgi:hypothetical protein
MKHTATQALVTIAIAAAIVVAVKVIQARAMEPKQEYWLPQEGTNLTTTIAGDWCMFSETKANPRVPSGRSQHYKPPQPGCSGVTVSGNSFNWTNGLTCTATHVNKWWKNAESWSAWRVSATCQSTRVSPTQYEFEFIHADPGPRPAGCLQSEGCEWWPSLIISTAPFIPDSVRNVGVSPPADSTPKSEAKPKDKDEEPPPPTPQIGERVTTEFFDYVRKKRGFDCQQAIKRHAEYGIRSPGALYGTNSGDSVFFHLRFSRKSRTVDGDGNMDLAGDEAEAQNGIGNWVGVKYICTVNVRTLEVRDTMLTRGRFVD